MVIASTFILAKIRCREYMSSAEIEDGEARTPGIRRREASWSRRIPVVLGAVRGAK